VKRFATVVFLVVAGAAIGAAASAHAGSSAARADGVAVVTKFPAAGKLTVPSVVVRSKPELTARKVTVMHDFRPDFRPQEILAVASATAPNGTPWYRISVPGRPNGRYGWIPAADADVAPTVAQIVVHRGRRTIDVYRHGKHVVHAIVAVGAPGMETPLGHYYVAVRYVPVNDPFLGVYALETSAYSKLSDWPGGGIVGIHGTNEPWLLGKAVSHGCVRVSNATASKLKRFAPVGTPIWIKAG
jgi:lipoprotein-anchoring transpeptidase ErfK/SrfK